VVRQDSLKDGKAGLTGMSKIGFSGRVGVRVIIELVLKFEASLFSYTIGLARFFFSRISHLLFG